MVVFYRKLHSTDRLLYSNNINKGREGGEREKGSEEGSEEETSGSKKNDLN
jgi:hypothetical protein